MQGIKVDFSGLKNFIDDYEYQIMEENVLSAHNSIKDKTCPSSNMLGWLDYANNITKEEIDKIKEVAEKIKREADVLIVIGIGGSYLGSKAIIDMFSSTLSNMETFDKRKHPIILYAGNNMSSKYLLDLMEFVSDKDIAINVISKSGKTLEPAIAFRMFKLLLEEKYGKSGASSRIYVTTDPENGLLLNMAKENNYETFVIPQNIGGRYSVLTPVGLLPMAVANIDIESLLDGAIFAEYIYKEKSAVTNDCYKYAACRNILNQKGKDIEVMTCYEPSFDMFLEWFKQLFGESEGKERKGIFPASCNFTTDLHSMGQLIQDGKRNIFETIINIEKTRTKVVLPEIIKNQDKLNYLAGKTLDYVNTKAMEGTKEAHLTGKVPCISINIEEVTEYNIGQLIYFFEKACAISALILKVDPFNQPGVEEYKNNMMKLLNN